MRAAMRTRRKQNRRADRQSRGAIKGLELGGDVTLVVQHYDECAGTLFTKHGIGAEWAGGVDSILRGVCDCGRNDVVLFGAKQAVFARVWIEASDRYFVLCDAD